MNKKKTKEPEFAKDAIDADVETMDYVALAKSIVEPEVDDGTVQVGDGQPTHRMEDFHCKNAEGVHQLITYIEQNGLQDKRGWNIAYDLYQCILAAAKKA